MDMRGHMVRKEDMVLEARCRKRMLLRFDTNPVYPFLLSLLLGDLTFQICQKNKRILGLLFYSLYSAFENEHMERVHHSLNQYHLIHLQVERLLQLSNWAQRGSLQLQRSRSQAMHNRDHNFRLYSMKTSNVEFLPSSTKTVNTH